MVVEDQGRARCSQAWSSDVRVHLVERMCNEDVLSLLLSEAWILPSARGLTANSDKAECNISSQARMTTFFQGFNGIDSLLLFNVEDYDYIHCPSVDRCLS